MAQNVTVAGASYSNVPSVELPRTGGGTAVFYDASIATATAAEILSGYTAFGATGLMTGTASGGGGLEYETGTFSPTANIAAPTINFANTHSKCPSFVVLYDVTDTVVSDTYTNLQFAFYEVTGFSGGIGSKTVSNSMLYGYVWTTYFGSKTTSTSTTSKNLLTPSTSQSSDQNNMARYYVNESWFKADTASSSRYWRQGRTYKWVAVWPPAT